MPMLTLISTTNHADKPKGSARSRRVKLRLDLRLDCYNTQRNAPEDSWTSKP